METNQRFTTAKEFAEIIRCHVNEVYYLASLKGFPQMRIGKKILVKTEPALSYIEKNGVNIKR